MLITGVNTPGFGVARGGVQRMPFGVGKNNNLLQRAVGLNTAPPQRSPFLDEKGNPLIGSFQDLVNYRQSLAQDNRPGPHPFADPAGPQPPNPLQRLVGLGMRYQGPMDQAAYDAWRQRVLSAHSASLSGNPLDPARLHDPFRGGNWSDWGTPVPQPAITPAHQAVPTLPTFRNTYLPTVHAGGPEPHQRTVAPTDGHPSNPVQAQTPSGVGPPAPGGLPTAYTGIQSTPVPQADIQAGMRQMMQAPGNVYGQYGPASSSLAQMLSSFVRPVQQENAWNFARQAAQQNQDYQLAAEQARANAGLGWGQIGLDNARNNFTRQQALLGPLLQLLGQYL